LERLLITQLITVQSISKYNYISSHFLKDCNWQYPTIIVHETLVLVVANQFHTCFCPRTIISLSLSLSVSHTHTHTHTRGSVSKQDNVACNAITKQQAIVVIISGNSSPSNCLLFTSQKQYLGGHKSKDRLIIRDTGNNKARRPKG